MLTTQVGTCGAPPRSLGCHAYIRRWREWSHEHGRDTDGRRQHGVPDPRRDPSRHHGGLGGRRRQGEGPGARRERSGLPRRHVLLSQPGVGRRARPRGGHDQGRRHQHADLLAALQRHRRADRARDGGAALRARLRLRLHGSRPPRLLGEAEQVHRQRRAGAHGAAAAHDRAAALLRLHAEPRPVLPARRAVREPVGPAAAGQDRRGAADAGGGARGVPRRRRVAVEDVRRHRLRRHQLRHRRVHRRRRVPRHAARHRDHLLDDAHAGRGEHGRRDGPRVPRRSSSTTARGSPASGRTSR